MAALLGPGLVLVFCLSQALRDVYFGHLFRGVDFFAVILLAFLLSTVIFTAIVVIRAPGEIGKLRGHGRTVLAANLTTALAWSCYFFGLTHIEPAIVNTLHSGMGPLTVIALAAFGVQLAGSGPVRWGEYFAYVGMALSLAGLWWVVLAESSGLHTGSMETNLAALALLAVSGGAITVSLLYCRRLHDHGISAEIVTSVRYLALIALAGGVVLWKGRMTGIDTLRDVATLSITTTALIVLPLFALQVGIARTAPLTAHVLRSLGPVFVFTAEQVDGRVIYSMPTFFCILAYSTAAIAANVAHGWRSQTGTRVGAACYGERSIVRSG
jgi:drug/metabolite transporter (DMT)-like permease